MKVERHTETGVYREQGSDDRALDRFTVYCLPPGETFDPAVGYAEQIKVDARDVEHAKEVAHGALLADYAPFLPVRIERSNWSTWTFEDMNAEQLRSALDFARQHGWSAS